MNRIKFELNESGKTIFGDCTFLRNSERLIPLVFLHGFKGYKDWGAFNLMADHWAKQGFFVLKFNFSHNGTTAEYRCDFVDLNAFGNNNFTHELDDLHQVLNYLEEEWSESLSLDQLALVAHSRGGATALLKACSDERVKKVVTWASVGTIKGRIPEMWLSEYQRTGVLYQLNSRTNQQMPVYYQLVEDYLSHEEEYNLEQRVTGLQTPVYMIHGTDDATVALDEAKYLHQFLPNAKLEVLDGGDHSFGQSEPWESSSMPEQLVKVLQWTEDFLKAES